MIESQENSPSLLPVVDVDIELGKYFTSLDVDMDLIAQLLEANGASPQEIADTTIHISAEAAYSNIPRAGVQTPLVSGKYVSVSNEINVYPLSADYSVNLNWYQDYSDPEVDTNDLNLILLHELGHRVHSLTDDYIDSERKHINKLLFKYFSKYALLSGGTFFTGEQAQQVLFELNDWNMDKSIVYSAMFGILAGLILLLRELKTGVKLGDQYYSSSPTENFARSFEVQNKDQVLINGAVRPESISRIILRQMIMYSNPGQKK